MRSPFPGVDPYLEAPELWSEVHSRLIVAIADTLTEHLTEKYRVAIEKRTYFSSEDDSLLVGIPDVSVIARRGDEILPGRTANLATLTEPISVTLPNVQEVQERYLEVREIASGAVITAIEILSPKNKRPGEGRNAYERKRYQILASLTHLVEIDWLRGGQPLPMLGSQPSHYRMLISRSDRRPTAQLYAFSVRQPIPSIVIPLTATDEEPMLPLQAVLQTVYERGRYQLAVDYSQPATPPLSSEDAAWAEALLYAQGFRI
ncbi:MAG: DUF4058 family protein [Tildeniella nuda ZEHNDER 1965/U140]|nr:DUF4058 family protein [Tildeniella nuda ZEHNDER 1965/U140]